jgi:hypothetical protein
MDMKSSSEVKMSVREYDSTVYDFGNVTAQDAIPNTNLPEPFTVATPTALSTTESLYDTIGSAGVKVRIQLDWIAANDRFVREYEVQWKKNGSSTWLALTVTRTLSARLDDADPDLYNFRVRSINTLGVRSEWATLSNVTIAGLTTPPVDVDGLSLVALNNSAHISWDLATDLDVRVGGKVRFRHSSVTSGAAWESSTDIGAAVAGHNTNAVLPLLTGTYMAKFTDSTGNESVSASSFVATTVPDIVKMNLVSDSAQQPLFTGTLTNLYIEDGILKLTEGEEAGSYEWSSIDLGQEYVSRVSTTITGTIHIRDPLFDARDTYIDDWLEFDRLPADLTSGGFALYIATTTSDPALNLWSEWTKFYVGDFRARAFKFKLEVTLPQAYNVNISALSALVDMPDRVQGNNAVQSGAGTKSIIYDEAFFAIPSVGVTGCDMEQNDRIVLSNETIAGFDVNFYQGNGTGNPVDINFNWQSRGY